MDGIHWEYFRGRRTSVRSHACSLAGWFDYCVLPLPVQVSICLHVAQQQSPFPTPQAASSSTHLATTPLTRTTFCIFHICPPKISHQNSSPPSQPSRETCVTLLSLPSLPRLHHPFQAKKRERGGWVKFSAHQRRRIYQPASRATRSSLLLRRLVGGERGSGACDRRVRPPARQHIEGDASLALRPRRGNEDENGGGVSRTAGR